MKWVRTNVQVQSHSFPTHALQKFIIVLFEKYASLLESEFSKRFETVRLQSCRFYLIGIVKRLFRLSGKMITMHPCKRKPLST